MSETTKPVRKVSEGISGMWHYHLSDDEHSTVALCGAKTMLSHIEVADWGVPFGQHFPKRPTYCKECERLAGIVR